jgi:predicted RND superfamily exporter protein
MYGDDEAFFRLPADRDLAAQFLLLFEMSLPYGLDLNNQINVDKSSLRLTATLRNISTGQARDLETRGKAWLAANFPSAASAEATGAFVMFAFISKRNIEGMLIGTTVAFVLISLVLIVALRHFKIGLISLVPNLVPAVMAFGIWGLFVGQVGMAASVVTATSLGIIVDATVHFLSKYLRARRQRGDTPEDAIRYAFSTVGTALWVTTFILVAGFAVLALSSFQLNQQMGLLTAIAMVCALIADFLLLPPLLLALDRSKSI